MTSPKSWSAFIAINPKGAGANFTQLSRFKARYSLAREFDALTLNKGSKGLQDSYSSALRVTLAYTALESLESALKIRNGISIIDPTLAEKFRKPRNEKFMDALLYEQRKSEMNHSQLELAKFNRNESQNLRPIVYAIRNLMSHGTLTAARLDLPQSIERRSLLDLLAVATLDATDVRFTKFVQKITQERARVK
jgi:hypothetical protein